MVGVAHNWAPYQHVQYPLNYFWWSGGPGDWAANIHTAQWPDRLIYSQERNFDPARNYVANAVEEHTRFGMNMPVSLNSFVVTGKLTLMKTENPDVRVVAKFRWLAQGAGPSESYILEYNLWSSHNSGGWCLANRLCGYSTHAGAHKAYIIMGGRAHGLPVVSANEGTTYAIDWGATIDWLQATDCRAWGGPVPCLPLDLVQRGENLQHVSTGFMTERNNFGEVWLRIEDMDVVQ